MIYDDDRDNPLTERIRPGSRRRPQTETPFPPHPSMEAGRTLPDGRRQVHVPYAGWRDERPSPYLRPLRITDPKVPRWRSLLRGAARIRIGGPPCS